MATGSAVSSMLNVIRATFKPVAPAAKAAQATLVDQPSRTDKDIQTCSGSASRGRGLQRGQKD